MCFVLQKKYRSRSIFLLSCEAWLRRLPLTATTRLLWGVLVLLKFAKLCGAPGFWENVFSFSGFYIEIAYSNFTFCGTFTLSFLGVPRNFSKTSTLTYRITACGMSFTLHSQSLVIFHQRFFHLWKGSKLFLF